MPGSDDKLPGGASERPPAFVCYCRRDWPFVRRLCDDLSADYRLFVDSQITPGEVWGDRVRQAIAQAETVFVVVSPDALASPHVQQEIAYAESLGKPLVPLILEDGAEHPTLQRFHYIDARSSCRAALREVRARRHARATVVRRPPRFSRTPRRYPSIHPIATFSSEGFPAPVAARLAYMLASVGSLPVLVLALVLPFAVSAFYGYFVIVQLLKFYILNMYLTRRLSLHDSVLFLASAGLVQDLFFAWCCWDVKLFAPEPIWHRLVLLSAAIDAIAIAAIATLPSIRCWLPGLSKQPTWPEAWRQIWRKDAQRK